MHEVRMTVRGNITNELIMREVGEGSRVVNFSIACNVRRRDQRTGQWVDQQTMFYRVSCWRALADNVAASFQKGDPVLVYGKVKQERWEKDGRNGEQTSIEAEYIGHDLNWGTSTYTKAPRVVTVESTDEAVDRELAADLAIETQGQSVVVDPLTGEVLPVDSLSWELDPQDEEERDEEMVPA